MRSGVVVEIGKSIQLTTPTSVSNDIGPVLSASTEVMPDPVSYWNAPLSTENPPINEDVARLPAPDKEVSILNIGSSVVDVAMVHAYF